MAVIILEKRKEKTGEFRREWLKGWAKSTAATETTDFAEKI